MTNDALDVILRRIRSTLADADESLNVVESYADEISAPMVLSLLSDLKTATVWAEYLERKLDN